MNIRKITVALFVLVVALSLASTHTAQAKTKKRSRTATGTYATPAIGAAGLGGGGCAQSGGTGCVEFATKKSDHTITITIADQSGQPVYASVSQDKATGDGVHQTTHIANICGKTTAPLKIEGGYPVDVFIWEGVGPEPPCAGVATQGSVTAVLSS